MYNLLERVGNPVRELMIRDLTGIEEAISEVVVVATIATVLVIPSMGPVVRRCDPHLGRMNPISAPCQTDQRSNGVNFVEREDHIIELGIRQEEKRRHQMRIWEKALLRLKKSLTTKSLLRSPVYLLICILLV